MAASARQTLACAIRGPIKRVDLPGLCRRICCLLENSGADVLLCDVSDVEPDAATVDALARIQLAARRRGCEARLSSASTELLELLRFTGLRDVLPG
jgi:ABC-type transporter Mla MlaB component